MHDSLCKTPVPPPPPPHQGCLLTNTYCTCRQQFCKPNKAIRDGKYLARHNQSSFWDTPLNFYMLNGAHVINDVKWRPIVTTFGTLIENMSRTGLYDLTIVWAILTAVLEFYMLNVKYWRIFCDVISLLAQVYKAYTHILVFYFSIIYKDIDLKFIQDTYRVVINSLKKNWLS